MARKFMVKMAEIYKKFCQFCPNGKNVKIIMGKIPKMAKTDDKNGKSGLTKM